MEAVSKHVVMLGADCKSTIASSSSSFMAMMPERTGRDEVQKSCCGGRAAGGRETSHRDWPRRIHPRGGRNDGGDALALLLEAGCDQRLAATVGAATERQTLSL